MDADPMDDPVNNPGEDQREAEREAERRILRDRLLLATLPHVPFDGWGMRALQGGARDAGMSEGDIHRLFPALQHDLLAHFSDWADRRMMARLKALDPDTMKIRERISIAVRVRLEELAFCTEAVRRASGLLLVPGGGAEIGAQSLYRTTDLIWRWAGDRATDFNFYTKRGLLSAVLTSTVLFWLQDDSEARQQTWAFLDRRIADVLAIPKLQNRLSDIIKKPFSQLVCRDSIRTEHPQEGMG